MATLKEIKQNIFLALKRLGLQDKVSLEEIEKELSGTDTAFQSLLMLGILRRIMDNKDNRAAELFIPAITQWKNYLPHKDLGGLFPAEMMQKYPPGPQEARFIRELMQEYQEHLKVLEAKTYSQDTSLDFNVEANFDRFQKEYFNRIPAEQAFSQDDKEFMTIKEIVIEERRQAGRPEGDIHKISLKIFAQNISEGLAKKYTEIEDGYRSALKELTDMQANPNLRSVKKVAEIRKLFELQESYHRCGPAPHQFYLNYAMVVFLDEENPQLAISLLDKALGYQPDYKIALEMKRRLSNGR